MRRTVIFSYRRHCSSTVAGNGRVRGERGCRYAESDDICDCDPLLWLESGLISGHRNKLIKNGGAGKGVSVKFNYQYCVNPVCYCDQGEPRKR